MTSIPGHCRFRSPDCNGNFFSSWSASSSGSIWPKRARANLLPNRPRAILNHATVVDPGHGLIIRSTGLKELDLIARVYGYVVSMTI